MDDIKQEISLRQSAKLRLIQNPNYFSNLSELQLPDLPEGVLKKVSDTRFEELTCVGYNPQTEILTAIVEIKQGSGYSGGPCTDGSDEFVRFYLDYGDGTWVDSGLAGFEAHDLSFDVDLCYAVSIHLDPERMSCCDRKPVLPRVRAILSWNTVPPANTPNWLPVWGNRIERHIQIEPRNSIFCSLFPADIGLQTIDKAVAEKIKAVLDAGPPLPKPVTAVGDLVEKNRKLELENGDLRAVFPAVMKLTAGKSDLAAFEALKVFDIDLSKFDDFIIEPNFNTTYEELHCVGLDRDLSRLHGVIQIKRNGGYSGDLCSDGSQEYIAFYLDFGNGWEYQGTTSVQVHDIDVPDGGLWYQASLPVNLDEHRQEWCKTGRARVRGILSWASPPPPNVPEYVPVWGDREDCNIEIRPFPEGIQPGIFQAALVSIGNMGVHKIDAGGYATGTAEGSIFTATDAPFGGRILLKGTTFSGPGGLMSYRVRIRRVADNVTWFHTQPFDADVTTYPNPIPATQTIAPIGEWYPWLEANPNVDVAGDLLGAVTGLQDGAHEVSLDFHSGIGGAYLGTTIIQRFMVDNTAPTVDVEITSGAGNCGKFGVGEVITGTYSMADDHAWYMTLHVTPTPEALPGTMTILPDAAAPITTVVSSGNASATLNNLGLTLHTTGSFGTWELDTTGMTPCGYNIRMVAEDRTIVNSATLGWAASDIEGFCLDE